MPGTAPGSASQRATERLSQPVPPTSTAQRSSEREGGSRAETDRDQLSAQGALRTERLVVFDRSVLSVVLVGDRWSIHLGKYDWEKKKPTKLQPKLEFYKGIVKGQKFCRFLLLFVSPLHSVKPNSRVALLLWANSMKPHLGPPPLMNFTQNWA